MSSSTSNSSVTKGLSLKTRFQAATYSVVTGLSYRPDGTVNRRLLNLIDLKSPPSATPIDGVNSSDHILDASRDLWFRLFVPVNTLSSPTPTSSLPVIIYFHGGGFVNFSPNTTFLDTLCRRLAGDVGAVVISVNYRHAPEHRFPSQYDDGFDVLKFIDGQRETVKGFPTNADVSKCFLAGDSAGGNLAHHLAVRISECDKSEFKAVRISGLIGIQPFFGGEERTDSELRIKKKLLLTLDHTDFYWKAFLPEGSNRDHPASNVMGSRSKDISGLDFPPTLVIVGKEDLLQDRQMSYCEWLKRSGKEVELEEYPNMFHGFYSAPELPEFSMLVGRIGEFLHKQLQFSSP